MKLGAEPKKIAIFAGLILLAAVLHFTGDGDPRQSAPKPAGGTPAAKAPAVSGSAGPRVPVTPAASKSASSRPNSSRRVSQEYKPVLRSRRVEDRVDPASIDPTLRTDVLVRLANVSIQGGNRPLFDFGSAPVPKAPDPGKIDPRKPVAGPKVVLPPPAPVAPVKVTPSKPQAPPIPLKFYGFTAARGGVKRAFFLENEDVFVANEGEIVKKRYKVVRINLNSVVMEDTQYNAQQTLALTEQSQ